MSNIVQTDILKCFIGFTKCTIDTFVWNRFWRRPGVWQIVPRNYFTLKQDFGFDSLESKKFIGKHNVMQRDSLSRNSLVLKANVVWRRMFHKENIVLRDCNLKMKWFK